MKDLKSILYVVLGAISYGLLATIVKYANGLGIHTSVLTFLQFFMGFLTLSLLCYSVPKKSTTKIVLPLKSKLKLILWGSTLGLTTTFYYLSIQYIPVSVGIILLMQSVWISLVLESMVQKQLPSWNKVSGVSIVLIGTILATNLIDTNFVLSPIGLAYGLAAGTTYAFSLFASSHIETQLPSLIRSKYFVLGGLLLICLFWNIHILASFQLQAIPWGLLLALFGTVIAPLFFTLGMPKVGISLGNIIASLEIPVSIISAILILRESVEWIQWIGIAIILLAILLINVKFITKKVEA